MTVECESLVSFTLLVIFLSSSFCDGDSSDESYPIPKEAIKPGFVPHFSESFNNRDDFLTKWVVSESKKDGVESEIARYDGDWSLDYPKKLPIDGDLGLIFKQKAKHRAISAKLNHPFVFKDKPLLLQYEVLFQDNQECGGAYLKLLSEGAGHDLKNFHDKTPYTIMFGPDKCGNTHKLHFIFRHKNPLNGSFEEKHSKGPSKRIDELFSDGVSHLYTLMLLPDNTYQIFVDREVQVKGSLLEDFTPPVNPLAEIDDPNDHKPEDWDEREKIPDETATKPDDWDETAPRQIPDPKAVKPDNWLESEPTEIMDPSAEKPFDWDDKMDGEWEGPMVPNPACEEAAGCGPWSPPMIDNPAYKGKWSPPLLNNPKYQGKWVPKKIPNPDFFVDTNPFLMTTIVSLGFELWSMSANIMFDNIVITDDEEYLKLWTDKTYEMKTAINNKNADTLWTRVMIQINYKPGWWALYFVYCMIPIGGYIWYLYRRVKEGSVLSRFLQASNEYPWLWAVYTAFPLIPIILYICYCLRKDQDDDEICPPDSWNVNFDDLEEEQDQDAVVDDTGDRQSDNYDDVEEEPEHEIPVVPKDSSMTLNSCIEEIQDEEVFPDDTSMEGADRANELDNERNESMDGVRLRFNPPTPSSSTEHQNLVNEQLDDDSMGSSATSRRTKTD